MRKKQIIWCSAFIATLFSITFSKDAVGSNMVNKTDSITPLRNAIEKAPDSLSLHEEFIKKSDLTSPALETQYTEWSSRFQQSAIVPYAFGMALGNRYDPRAKQWLLEAVKRHPSLAPAWQSLSFDAERWGDEETGNYYMGKAAEADPQSPDYAFYHASAHKRTNPAEYEERMLEVVRRFPDSQRAPQALYWLAHEAKDTTRKIELYKFCLDSFPPKEFRWTSSSMSDYYGLLLEKDPSQAIALAEKMIDLTEGNTSWQNQLLLAQQVNDVQRLLKEGKAKDAQAIMEEVKPTYSTRNMLTLLATKTIAEAGHVQQAYDSLLNVYSRAPLDEIYPHLAAYGEQLGKSADNMESDISAKINANAEPATDFLLDQYTDGEPISLESLKGKVVFITYWYPGCGPCRGEFPHLESVLAKYNRDEIVYLGINIAREQDGYVDDFMTGTGYTFIPLKEEDDRDKGNLDNRRAAPMNFLIDRDGRVVFSNFMINAKNESMFERMISLLL